MIGYDKMGNIYNTNKLRLKTSVVIQKSDEPTSFDVQLERMVNYMRHGSEDTSIKQPRHSAADKTIKSALGNMRAIYNKMGGVEFTPQWAHEVSKRLELDGLGTNSRKTYLFTIENFFRGNGYNLNLIKPIKTYQESEFHSIKEIKSILSSCDNVRDLAILCTLYFEALRNKELQYLWISDVDMKSKILHVRDHGQGVKGYESRDIPIFEEALQPLQDWIDFRTKIEPEQPYLFLNQRANKFTENGLCWLVQKYAKRVNLKTKPHKFRHSRCTHLGNDFNWNPFKLQKFMGHKSIETTLLYVHTTVKDLQAESARTDRLWEKRA